MKNTPKYITDNNGKRVSVIVDLQEYKTLIEQSEELEDIRLYDTAKKQKQEFIPAEKAFKDIENNKYN